MKPLDIHASRYAEMILNHAPVGLAVYDAQDLRLLEANTVFLTLLDTYFDPRWGQGKAVGQSLRDWGVDARWGIDLEAAGTLGIFQEVVRTGKPFRRAEYPLVTMKQGTTYWDWALDPVFDQDGKVQYLVHTTVEVTQQVLSRQRAERAQSELSQKNSRIEAERKRLEVIETVASSVRESLNLEQIGSIAIEAICAHFPMDGIYLHVAEPVQKGLRLLCSHLPAKRKHSARAIRTIAYEHIFQNELPDQQREPIIIEDVRECSRAGSLAKNPLICSATRGYVCVPLWFGDRFEGTLAATFSAPIEANSPEASVLIGCSTHIAAALAHGRLHSVLKQERNHLRAILDQLPEGILMVEAASGKIRYANSATSAMLGVSMMELTEFPFYRYHNIQDQDKLIREGPHIPPWHFMAISALCGQIIRGKDALLIKPDGKQLIVLTSSMPLYNEQGAISGAIVVLQDITEQKSLEQHKDEFLSIINHELRTPITVIQGFAEILQLKLAQDNPADTVANYALSSINEQSQHLIHLIEEMLDVSHIEHAQFTLQRSQQDLLAIFQRVIATQAITTRQHEIRLNIEGWPANEPLSAYIDEKRVSQMLSNLISNAIKYSPAGGEIEVGVRVTKERPGKVLLRVADQGIGIAASETEVIFKRFHRAKNIDSSLPGFGVGLYLVKEVATRHGGRVWVESTVGKGSTFYVELPLSRA